MTMKEIRAELEQIIVCMAHTGRSAVVGYYNTLGECFERFYKTLEVNNMPSEFIEVARSYQIHTGNYKTFPIAENTVTCDSKKVARDFFQWWVLM